MSEEPQLSVQMQALLNRLQARLGSGLADAAASLLATAEGAPARLTQEWTLFWEEVQLEAQRLETGEASAGPASQATAPNADVSVADAAVSRAPVAQPHRDPQALIDGLRARVTSLSQHLDA